MKINIWGVAIGIVVVISLFGPWISKSTQPWSTINPDTGQGELRYHRKIVLSPLFAQIYEDGALIETVWFVSFGTALAGVFLLSSAAMFALKYTRIWVDFSLFISAFLGVVIFFMSLGMGQAVGLRTNLEWGTAVVLMGISLMLALSVSNLLKHPSLKK